MCLFVRSIGGHIRMGAPGLHPRSGQRQRVNCWNGSARCQKLQNLTPGQRHLHSDRFLAWMLRTELNRVQPATESQISKIGRFEDSSQPPSCDGKIALRSRRAKGHECDRPKFEAPNLDEHLHGNVAIIQAMVHEHSGCGKVP